MTFTKMSSRYNDNNLSNLNCWMDGFKQESNKFKEIFADKAYTQEESACANKISEALQKRSKEFWTQRESLEDKNAKIYTKKEKEFEAQLKELESQTKY